MTEEPGAKDALSTLPYEELDPRLRDPRVLAWFGEHLTELRRDVYGQRILYQSLAFGFVIGLAGIPIGALIGLCYALELLAQPAEAPIPGSILGLAMVLGTVFVAMLIAVSQSHGASPFEVLEFGYLATIGLGVVSLLVGVGIVSLATHWSVAIGRRLDGHADIRHVGIGEAE